MLGCFDVYCPFNASFNTDKEVFQCNRAMCIDDENQGFYGHSPSDNTVREDFEE